MEEQLKRYFLEISYHGKNYCGWQVQPDKVTVQSTINEALGKVFNRPVMVTGCGRTDSGVHASQFFLHFDGPREAFKLENISYRLNKMLPEDIAVHQLLDNLPEDAHSRYDATYRAYDYYMHFKKNPFKSGNSAIFPWLPLNIEAMKEVSSKLPNYIDFPMLCKTGGSSKTTLCTIFKTELIIDVEKDQFRFHVAANRFLRGMVRRMVGLLVMVGKEKISVQEFEDVMENKGTFSYNLSVPAAGLYLSEVRYPYIKSSE